MIVHYLCERKRQKNVTKKSGKVCELSGSARSTNKIYFQSNGAGSSMDRKICWWHWEIVEVAATLVESSVSNRGRISFGVWSSWYGIEKEKKNGFCAIFAKSRSWKSRIWRFNQNLWFGEYLKMMKCAYHETDNNLKFIIWRNYFINIFIINNQKSSKILIERYHGQIFATEDFVVALSFFLFSLWFIDSCNRDHRLCTWIAFSFSN